MRCMLGSPEFLYQLALGLGCCRITGAALLMVLLLFQPVISCETIVEKWSGSYQAYRSDLLNVEYHVRYTTNDGLAITMVLIDLEPRQDFTHELKDPKVEGGRISFSFKKPHEVKRCELIIQEDGSYMGHCQADIDPDAERVTSIVMKPPSNENETQ